MAFLKNGFSATYTFAGSSIATLKEIAVKPPGVDSGGPIDQTTMKNSTYRTASPKSLKTLTEAKATVAYDAAILTTIIAQVGVNQLITVNFPDGHHWAFYGFLDKFEPGELKEGERPTADITIAITNLNATDVETAPSYT